MYRAKHGRAERVLWKLKQINAQGYNGFSAHLREGV